MTGDYEIQTIPEDIVGSEVRDEVRFSKQGIVTGKQENLYLKRLQGMRKEGVLAKKAKTPGWDMFPAFYRGNHYPAKMPKHKVKAVLNLIQQLVERKAALLTDSKPMIKVVPTTYAAGSNPKHLEQQSNAAQAIECAIGGIWRKTYFSESLAKAITLAEIFGCVGFHIPWNMGIGTHGDVDLQHIDPRMLIFDPYISDSRYVTKNRVASYMFLDEILPTAYLQETFKSKRDLIKGDVRYASDSIDEGGAETIFGKLKAMFDFGATGMRSSVDRTLISRGWISNFEKDGDIWKYAGGKYIVMTRDQLLVDKANPYIDNEWPIDFLDWHFDPDSALGFGDLELYKSPQELFDKMVALMVENAALMNNNIWVGDDDALDPKGWNNLSNIPGSYVKKRRGRSLERVAPPALSNGTNELIKFLMGSMEKLSSVSEALQGNAAGSVTSGIAIENLQTASQTVIRLKARQLEAVLTSMGNKMISRIFQYMTDDRVYTLCGDAGQLLAYHWERKKVLSDPAFAFDNFHFEIVPGSSLSMTKWQRGMLATQLFAQGLIDEKAALDALEYPDKEEIMKRMADAQIAQMDQQIQMAQMSGQIPGMGSQQSGGAKGGNRKAHSVPRPQAKSAAGDVEQRVQGSPDIDTRRSEV